MQAKQKKVLKIMFWVLGSIIGLIVVALTALQVYVNSDKPAFVKMVNEKLNDAIAGTANIKSIDINVWRHFPNVDIQLHDVVIRDSVYNKPLINIKFVSTRINALKLISNEVDIHNIYMQDGTIALFTDKNGFSNSYIFKKKKKDDQKSGNPTIIQEIELKNINLKSEHAIKNKWFGVSINYLHADVDYRDSITTYKIEENALIRGLGFNLQKGYYLKDKTIAADWEITYNNNSKQLSFPETPVKVGATDFLLTGDFYMADTTNSHFRVLAKAGSIGYNEAGTLVSPNIQKKVNLVELTKPLALTATIEGPLAYKTIPIVNVQWVVKDNELVTPAVTLDSCSFTGSFTNERNKDYPRTDDNSEVMLTKLSASWGGISLIANTNTIVTNLVHPILQFDFSSATTLAALDEKLALSSLRFTKGQAKLNLQYSGPLGVNAAMLQYLSGNLVIKDAQVNYTPRNLTFDHANGEILFSQSDLLVKNLQCDLNTNHFKVEVAGHNVNVLAQTSLPGTAELICSVFTPDLNLNDFKSLFAARNTAAAPKKGGVAKAGVQLDDVLTNGTLDMTLKANAVHMNRFTAKDVQAKIAFKDNDMDVQKVQLLTCDGRMDMNAKIHQVAGNYHEAATNINVQNINVQKLFYAFNNFGLQSLTSDNLHGTLNTDTHIKIGIDGKGNLIPNSTTGNLQFSLKNGALKGFEPIKKIQSFIFKNRDLDNIEFAELKDSLELRKDEIYVHRMEIESSALTLFVEGIYSFSNNTNLSIQVPLNNLKKRDEDYEVKNKGAKRKGGASVYLRAKSAKDGSVKVGLDVFKKLRGDKFEEDFKDDTESADSTKKE